MSGITSCAVDKIALKAITIETLETFNSVNAVDFRHVAILLVVRIICQFDDDVRFRSAC